MKPEVTPKIIWQIHEKFKNSVRNKNKLYKKKKILNMGENRMSANHSKLSSIVKIVLKSQIVQNSGKKLNRFY